MKFARRVPTADTVKRVVVVTKIETKAEIEIIGIENEEKEIELEIEKEKGKGMARSEREMVTRKLMRLLSETPKHTVSEAPIRPKIVTTHIQTQIHTNTKTHIRTHM